MKTICGGMEYRYDPDTGELFNNYGTKVAETDETNHGVTCYVMVEPEYDKDIKEVDTAKYLISGPAVRMVDIVIAYTEAMNKMGYSTRTGIKE